VVREALALGVPGGGDHVKDVVSRAARTILQLLAGGAFAQLFLALTNQADVQYQTILTCVFSVVVAFAQNYLEDTGKIPTILGKKESVDVRDSRPRIL